MKYPVVESGEQGSGRHAAHDNGFRGPAHRAPGSVRGPMVNRALQLGTEQGPCTEGKGHEVRGSAGSRGGGGPGDVQIRICNEFHNGWAAQPLRWGWGWG